MEETQEADSEVLQHVKTQHGFKSGAILGKGSYGTVYSISSKKRGELAAKLVPKRYCNPTEMTEWEALEHANVLRLLYVTISLRGTVVFITDLMVTNLFHRLQDKSFKMDENALERCRRYSREALAGMAYLHSRLLCHTDLRAENVLLAFDDRAVVADFSGLCKAREKKRSCPLPNCLKPPEMFLRKKVWPRPVDLWSCGLLIASVFLGRTYYEATIKHPRHGTIQAVEQYTTLFRCDRVAEKAIHNGYPNCKIPEKFCKDLTNLIDKFLQIKPKHRLAVNQALSHPSMTSLVLIDCDSSSSVTSSPAISRSSLKLKSKMEAGTDKTESEERAVNVEPRDEKVVKVSRWKYFRMKFFNFKKRSLPCLKKKQVVEI